MIHYEVSDNSVYDSYYNFVQQTLSRQEMGKI